MTKKHYIAIAAMIKKAYEASDTYQRAQIEAYITNPLLLMFKEDNPRFDIERFMKAIYS